jgi:hypothetical protein
MNTTFNSDNATIKHRLMSVAKNEAMAAALNFKSEHAANNGVLGNPRVAAAAAYLGRRIQASDALPEAVVLDCRQTLGVMLDNPQAAAAMASDVSNWEEINFPFPSQLIRLEDSLFLLVYHLTDKEEGGTNEYYNVSAYSTKAVNLMSNKEDPDGVWRMLDIDFQLNADNPTLMVTDNYYESIPEAQKSELRDNNLLAKASLYVILYLLHHKKVEFGDRAVPTSRNHKRLKRNQPPYSEYKQAVLGDYARRPPKLTTGEEPSTHASPKMHMRCGHWRRRPHSEEKIWIRSTVVGDPSRGIVVKEYKL